MGSSKWLAAMMTVTTWFGVKPAVAEVAVGDPAPSFELPGSDGRTYSLAQYKGKQGVVLAWFPKAATPG